MLNGTARNHRMAIPALACGVFRDAWEGFIFLFFFTFKGKLWKVVSYHWQLKLSLKLLDRGRKIKQDRRWNADKPLAALDPYILTWWTTSPANHRPANFWKSFFLKHWNEIVKSVAISGWTDEDQLQIWSSHSLIHHVQIITYKLSFSL